MDLLVTNSSILFCCTYYQKSPVNMMENTTLLPAFTTELPSIGGIERFSQIKSLFKLPNRKFNSSWVSYFSLFPDIRKLVCAVCGIGEMLCGCI